MNNNIAVIGGDLRIVKLANILAKEKNIITFGLDKAEEVQDNKNIIFSNSLNEALENAQIIIGPMPFSKNGEVVNAQFTNNEIQVSDLIEGVKDKVLIAGAISQEIRKMLQENNIKFFDLMDQEELTVLNTIATAEGAVQVAMEKTQKIIHGSKVLILGFGRVGKATAQKFAGLSAKVTCAARNPKDFAWAEVYGYDCININNLGENLKNYDIIINTPPTLILTKERLMHVKKDCLIIDLASKPGGVDTKAISELELDFEWALALPGKVAPITAAKHIKNTIENILNKL